MSEDAFQAELLHRYVLGTLDEAEQSRVEEAYFADPARVQELWAVFDEVAERFLQRELSPTETQQFAAHLHNTPQLFQRVLHLQSLLTTIAPPATPPVAPASPSFWAPWRTVMRWQWAVATTALLVMVASVLWWKRTPAAPVPVAVQSAPTPQPTASPPLPSISPALAATPATKPPPPAAALATFFLLNKTVRDPRDAMPLPIPPLTQTIELQLELPLPLHPRYQVMLQTEDGRTRTIPNLRPQRRQGRGVLMLRVPVATVAAAPFTLQVNGLPTPLAPVLVGTHRLQVQKQ